MNGLSVVIPSKSRKNLMACLDAIGTNESRPWRIVVDDGVDLPDTLPTNTPCSLKDAHFGWTEGCELFDGAYERCIRGAKPFNFSSNCNLGIRESGMDDVILCNDDALLRTPGGFTAMQRVAEERPEYGIIGAVTNVTGQPLQWPQNVGLREVEHFAFVCVLIPRRTIERVGLLDERYCLDYGCEDRDYCEAVRRAGLKCGVFDGCYVDHGSLTSTYRGDPQAPKDFSRNYELFKQKWGVV